jgi:HlyD family secretion protein
MKAGVARNAIGATIVLGFAGFLAWAFWPRPLPVEVAAITRGAMQVAISDEGKTRVKDVYSVSAPVAGRVLRIEAEVGDTVVAGETIVAHLLPSAPAFLDARALSEAQATVRAAEAAVELARAERRRAQAEIDYAKLEVDRVRDLVKRQAKSVAELDRVELNLKLAKVTDARAVAAIDQRQAELETAKAVLIDPATPESVAAGRTVGLIGIKAPVSGRVLAVLRQSEGVVAAGTPLVELGDPTRLEVVVDLLSTSAVKVSPGDVVDIVDWGGPGALKGRVLRVEPTGVTKVSSLGIEEQRVNVIVVPATGDAEWTKLGHGFRVQARIIVWSAPDVVRVPAGALFRLDREWAVFKLDDGRARLTVVGTGHVAEDWVEVTSGLAVGDKVIVHPARAIEDRVAVVPRNPATRG